jgi:hypothetical protein
MATSILNVKKLKFIYKKDRVRAMVFNASFKLEFRKKIGLGLWCLTLSTKCCRLKRYKMGITGRLIKGWIVISWYFPW